MPIAAAPAPAPPAMSTSIRPGSTACPLPDGAEADMLDFVQDRQPNSRLSCQIEVTDATGWPGRYHAGEPALRPSTGAQHWGPALGLAPRRGPNASPRGPRRPARRPSSFRTALRLVTSSRPLAPLASPENLTLTLQLDQMGQHGAFAAAGLMRASNSRIKPRPRSLPGRHRTFACNAAMDRQSPAPCGAPASPASTPAGLSHAPDRGRNRIRGSARAHQHDAGWPYRLPCRHPAG